MEKHPELDWFIRKRVLGEFGPLDRAVPMKRANHVLVTRTPSGRYREPFLFIRGRGYPSRMVPREHAPLDHAKAACEEVAKASSGATAIPVDDIDMVDDHEDWPELALHR
jgi:hypothetical protein